MEAGVDIETPSPLIKCALRGFARSHTDAGKRHRVLLPVTLGMLVGGESLSESWGVGNVVWMCLAAMCFNLLRAGDVGVVFPVHWLTRGQTAFRRGERQLEYVNWRQAD